MDRAVAARQPPQTPRAAAPLDLTGNWVAVISEDWRWRMVTPAKGDYLSIPLTQKAKDAADTWDPAKDTAAGEQCRSYGAPALMRTPTRLRISWRDDTTLLVEIGLRHSDASPAVRAGYARRAIVAGTLGGDVGSRRARARRRACRRSPRRLATAA